MSLIQSANLRFSEEELAEFIECAWRKAIFQRKNMQEAVMVNKGVWGLVESWEVSEKNMWARETLNATYRGNIVWEMIRRGVLGETYLENYDAHSAKRAINFLRQSPLFFSVVDMYSKDPTEVRRGEFRGLLYLIAGGRGELGDFSHENYIISDVSGKSDTLWTGGAMGGLVL
ncbi:MAG: hypothetical protein KKB21_04145 [Nanoarchaeota archaeon]|nr:hypothetical protein [Nanoarchaeota archaeon]MBU4086738.1 hypothetical protein [Nanoarchaeota archaeon]